MVDQLTETQIVALLRDLVQTRSFNPPGEEAAVGSKVADWLRRTGLVVTVQPISGERANVVGRLPGDGTRPALLLCAHQDTVPPGSALWSHEPLGGEIIDGRLYGRGALDTKASLTAMMAAAQAVRAAGVRLHGDLIVLATVDEESMGQGAQGFLEGGGMEGVGAVVIGEPTSLDIVIAHRGALWLEITTQGKAAHGAMPELGVNAILPMAAILGRLGQYSFVHAPDPLLRPPTINVATIQGGVKTNMVPDHCQATVDIRTVPGQSHASILAEVRRLASEVAREWSGLRVDVQAINDKPPLATPSNAALIEAAAEVAESVLGRKPAIRGAPYLTDGSLLAGTTNTPAIICGPGPETLAHQADEYIELAEVFAAVRLYTDLAFRLLA